MKDGMPLPTRNGKAKRGHKALPWRELPQFMDALRQRQSISAKALEFLILTAARTGEAIGAQVRSGDQVALLVPNDADLLGPLGIRNSAKAQKQEARLDRPLLAGFAIAERDARSMSSPCRATTLLFGRISIFGVCVTRSTRYSETLSFNRSPRMTMVTLRA